MQKFMMRHNLKIIMTMPKHESIGYYCYNIVNHPYFEKTIIFFIFLNIVAMGVIYKGISE